MSNFSKKISVWVLVGAGILSFSGMSFAADSENSVTGFFRRLFHYPAQATQETAGMTANTLNNTGEKVVAKVGENTAEVLQGDLSQTGAIVTDTVQGSADTVGQTASETVQIPVKAADEQPQQ